MTATLLVVALAASAACSSGDDADDSVVTAPAAGSTVPTTTTPLLSTPATSPAGSVPASTAPSTTGSTSRIVETALGPVEVPADPQRVVALAEEFLLADLLALGVTPVASTAMVAEDGFFGLDEFDTTGIEALPATEPNLERLAALRPDLIVTTPFFVEEIGREVLDGLAPTVAIEIDDERAAFSDLAAVFDRHEEAEAILADLDGAVAEAITDVAAEGRDVSVATVYPGSTVAVWVEGPSAVPQLLLDLGFTLVPGPADVSDRRGGRAYISLEQLGSLTGESLVLLQSTAVEGEEQALAELSADPLWQTILAVQVGRVVELDRLAYPGVAGRLRLVDDVTAALRERPDE